MPDLVIMPNGAASREAAGLSDLPVLGEFAPDFPHEVKIAAAPAITKRRAMRFTNYSFDFRAGRNQADSLLLHPFVVSLRKSASEAWFRSTIPSRSAGTAKRSQPGA